MQSSRGKPLAYGSISVKGESPNDLAEVKSVPFFGLPGNPVSSFVTFTVIAKPYLLKYQGQNSWLSDGFQAVSRFEFETGGRREYLRVKIRSDSTDTPVAELFDGQGSGVMSSVSWANALALIEPHTKVHSGDKLLIYRLPT